MPRVAKERKPVEVKNLKRPGFHAVGGVPGLLLHIAEIRDENNKGTGEPNLRARSWVLRATIAGSVRMAGLGPYPEVKLSQAREKARTMREAIREGRDPIEERKAQKRRLALERAKQMTFKEAAIECHKLKWKAEYRSQGHVDDWIGSLARYAFPVIGKMPIAEVKVEHVLQVLQPIWTTKTGGTATNVRRRMEAVFDWATPTYREGENPARWKGVLSSKLSSPTKIHEVQHRKAVPWQQMPTFMEGLRQRQDPAAQALEFLILTAARSGEITKAEWPEIDFDNKVWTVPAEHMKAGKQHRVPLCDDARTLLNDVERQLDVPHIFLSPRGLPVTDEHLRQVTRAVSGDPKLTVHGFRSSFRDWAAERTKFPPHVAEMCLAHTVKTATEKAYFRSDLLPKRFKVMQAWARFLREPMQTGNVVSIGQGQTG